MKKCSVCNKELSGWEGALIEGKAYCSKCEVEHHVKELEEAIKLEYEGY